MTRDELGGWVRGSVELSFTRSSGPGGQNVNKVSTRVTARLRLSGKTPLTDAEMSRLRQGLAGRINSDDELVVDAQRERSQSRNRAIALSKMEKLIRAQLQEPKHRRSTGPTRASVERRLQRKRARGERKRQRGEIDMD